MYTEFHNNTKQNFRTNSSLKSRAPNARVDTVGSFQTSIDNEYFANSTKFNIGLKTSQHEEPSPVKKYSPKAKNSVQSNEYYPKEVDYNGGNTSRRKIVKNTATNFNIDVHNGERIATYTSVNDQDVSTVRVGSMNDSKFPTRFKKKLGIDALRQSDGGVVVKTEGQSLAATPKIKIASQKGSTTFRDSEFHSAAMPSSKAHHFTTEEDAHPSAYEETRSSVSRSHRRSSTTMQEMRWENLNLPVSADFVMENYESFLSPYEKNEIDKFPQIYFLSDINHKLVVKEDKEYDDERGDYLVVKNDHIRYRYEALEMLGRGSFGQVVKVFDHKRRQYAAVKVIRSQKKFYHQSKTEIKILRFMMEHDGSEYNVAGVRDYFVFRNHVCLVFDLMDVNLYDLLKKNKFRPFPVDTVRKFAIQMLYALKFLRHHNIIHCDLKPENILLKAPNKTGITLIDFGSSCFDHEKVYTYIQSRFYRSPEIILGLPYTTQIDMWSFGCLLCELYLGYPVFSGDSEKDQLFNMFEVLGLPNADLISSAPRKAKFFDDDLKPMITPNNKGKMRVPDSSPLSSHIRSEDRKLLDLIKWCLTYNPTSRYTPDDALCHEWVMEGLPEHLKEQHLEFVRNPPFKYTAPNSGRESKEHSSSKGRRNSRHSQTPKPTQTPSKQINTPKDGTSFIHDNGGLAASGLGASGLMNNTSQLTKSIVFNEGSVADLRGSRTFRMKTYANDEQHQQKTEKTEGSLEPVDKRRNSQKRHLPARQAAYLNAKEMERPSSKVIYKKQMNTTNGKTELNIAVMPPTTTVKNLSQLYFERDLSISQTVKSTNAPIHMPRSVTEKIPYTSKSPPRKPNQINDSSTKQSLVTWEGSNTQRGLYSDDRINRANAEAGHSKKGSGSGFFSYFSNKGSSSVERPSQGRKEKSPYKTSILPTLKLSMTGKKVAQ